MLKNKFLITGFIFFLLLGFSLMVFLNTFRGYSILKKVVPDPLEQRLFYEFNSLSKELNFFQIFRRLSFNEDEYIDIYLSNDDFNHIENKKSEFLDIGFIKDEINDWREAEVRIANVKYKMSYKFQGTSVSSLDRYSAMSYKIKLKNKNPFFQNLKRINLINYLEEATISTIAANSFANEFDLLSINSKVVPLRINSTLQRQPYIFQEDFRNEWLERDHQINNYVVLKPNDDWDRKEPSHQSMLDLYIQDYESYGNNPKPEIAHGKLKALLESVRANDVSRMMSLIDVDYFARYVAYSYLINNSHPIYGDNLRFVYDYTCGCFRVIYRLEDRINPINLSVESFNQSWFSSVEAYQGAETFRIFKLLLTDKGFLEKRDAYLAELVDQEEKIIDHFNEKFSKNFRVIKAFHFPIEELYDFRTNISNLRNNFKAIKNYLDYGKIFASYDTYKKSFSLVCDSYHDILISSIFVKDFNYQVDFLCESKLTENLEIIPIVHKLDISDLVTDHDISFTRPFMQAVKPIFQFDIDSSQTYVNNVSTQYQEDFVNFAELESLLEIDHEKRTIFFKAGTYKINKNIIFPIGYHSFIEPGTEILLGKNNSILFQGSLNAEGTEDKKIFIKPLHDEPFGVFAVSAINEDNSRVELSNFVIQGGSEAYVNGVQFLGQLSIYHIKDVIIDGIDVLNSTSDDGLNIKNAYVEITGSNFSGNNFDQVDLDYCKGFVSNNNFVNNVDESLIGGDGLDLSGSDLLVEENVFTNFRDKGISIGEKTLVTIKNNIISENINGIAVKDGSIAHIHHNNFNNNSIDISAYIKKKFYEAPRLLVDQKNKALKINLDNGSEYFPINSI